MSIKKFPTAKLARTVITAKATAQIAVKHAAHMGQKPFLKKQQLEKITSQHEQDIGKILLTALMQLRGTALKIAQLMSMQLDMLPEGIRIELSKACSEVTPLNRAHIRKVFKSEFNKSPEDIYKYFNTKAFAAASLGQVHQATVVSHDNRNLQLAIKIQYPGIGATIKSDMTMVRAMMKTLSTGTSLLPRYEVIDKILDRINEQLKCEIDYELEAENTIWFEKNLKIPGVRVPKVYQEYSSANILATEYIQGQHLEQWLLNEPSQRQRNQAGQLLFDLFCYQLHELKFLHADPHPGNLLFCENNQIALLDFGCVHQLHPDYPDTVANLFTRDTKQLYQTFQELKMINKKLSLEKFQQEFFPVIQDMHTWMTTPFLDKEYDFSKMPSMPANPLSQIPNAMKHIHDIQIDQMYFDRSFFGLLFILRKLGANINTTGLLRS